MNVEGVISLALLKLPLSHLSSLTRQGVLPYPRFWASTRPFNTPLLPYLLKWVLTVIVVIAPPAGDAFNFSKCLFPKLFHRKYAKRYTVVDLQSYPSNVFSLLMTLGLFFVRKRRLSIGAPKTEFRAWNVVLVFALAVNVYILVLPWVPPAGGIYGGDVSFFYATYCIVGLAMCVFPGFSLYVWNDVTKLNHSASPFAASPMYSRFSSCPSGAITLSASSSRSCRTARKPRGLSRCRTLSSRSGTRRMMSTEMLWIGKPNPLRHRELHFFLPHSLPLGLFWCRFWDNNSLMIIGEHNSLRMYLSTSVLCISFNYRRTWRSTWHLHICLADRCWQQVQVLVADFQEEINLWALILSGESLHCNPIQTIPITTKLNLELIANLTLNHCNHPQFTKQSYIPPHMGPLPLD